MKNIFLMLAFFSFCQLSMGQESSPPISTDGKGLSDSEFLLAKEGYLKMSYSEAYITHRKATLLMIDKLGEYDNEAFLTFFRTDENFSKWISENLKSTKFKSPEEAIELRKLMIDTQEKMIKENAEAFEFLWRATLEQGVEILKPDRLTTSEIDEMQK